MLYAYCICEEDNQDNFLENSFIGGHFGAEVSETASWERTLKNASLTRFIWFYLPHTARSSRTLKTVAPLKNGAQFSLHPTQHSLQPPTLKLPPR
ncbi:MAG: hypothetical protein LW865_17380 [Betaproteobacteria bacterium]|jgi:hypothetical protein|nr:hypothetical protein [Betaproteobacteria bacterium]